MRLVLFTLSKANLISEPSRELSLEPSRFKATVLTTTPSCSSHYRYICQVLAKINYLAFVYSAQGYCSHIVGLIYTLDLIKAQQSPAILCTSLPQQWHKPGNSKIKGVPISSIVNLRRPIDCCYRGRRASLHKMLKHINMSELVFIC